jgi:hypothetical protein
MSSLPPSLSVMSSGATYGVLWRGRVRCGGDGWRSLVVAMASVVCGGGGSGGSGTRVMVLKLISVAG